MPLKQWLYFWIGLAVLSANRIRYGVTGYHRPAEFSSAHRDEAVRYAWQVVGRWERSLIEKGFGAEPFYGKRVLELGPGADLSVGLILLAKGAQSYTAFDKHPHADRAPKELHDAVLASIPDAGARERVREALAAHERKEPTALMFKQDESFSLSFVPDASVDLVASNAAFEHFDDVPAVLADVARMLVPGGAFVAQVDLQTHTRIIRNRDPLNIYRYPSWIFRLAKFSGIPNRVRPAVYQKVLEDNGMTLVSIMPDVVLDEARVEHERKYMHRKFRKDPMLGVMSFIVVAKK